MRGKRAAIVVFVLGGVSLAWAWPARGAEPRLVLDSFSFFLFEGTSQAIQVPSGSEVPVVLEPVGSGRWSIAIPPAALVIPPIRYPSGLSVRWTLSAPATGELVLSGGTASCSIRAPLVAHVEGRGEVPFPLSFTTEAATSSAGGLTAAVEGSRFDPASGSLQLVAAGVNPTHAKTAPGKPFYVVLSGRVVNLPAGLTAR
jgi:hypothetical protein